MAVDENQGSESTGLSCLTTARYIVAAVVTVLAVTIVLMVIAVGVRPENMSVSIVQGRIKATRKVSVGMASMGVVRGRHRLSQAWKSSRSGKVGGQPVHMGVIGQGRAASSGRSHAAGRPTDTGTGTGTGGSQHDDKHATVSLEFRVILGAYNPSGRTDIRCDNITISFLDMPSAPYSFDGMVEIAKVDMAEGFPVRRQTSHLLTKVLVVQDRNTVSYLETAYGKGGGFTAMVQVDAVVTSMRKTKATSLYCWPLPVRYGGVYISGGSYTYSSSGDAVTCKTTKEMFHPVASAPPAPQPAPAPTAGDDDDN